MDFFNEEDTDREIEDDIEEEWNEDVEYVSYVCEDCDYRWEEGSEGEGEYESIVCPMCGSINVTQL